MILAGGNPRIRVKSDLENFVRARRRTFREAIRKFELWVDGRKLSEQHNSWGNYAWFNLSTTLAAGKHSCTLNVTTIDNDAKAYNFNLTVQ